jgi:hypothetical protein
VRFAAVDAEEAQRIAREEQDEIAALLAPA